MPNCLKRWKGEKARLYRNRSRKTYYNKTAYAENHGKPWTIHDLERVAKHEIPDSQLSKEIGRSVAAIQIQRRKLRKD